MKDEHPQRNQTIDSPIFAEPPVGFLKWAIALILGSSAAFLIILFIVAPEQMQTARAGGPVVLSLVATAALVLLSRGKIKASAYLLGAGLWAYTTGISLLLGGLNSIIIIAYPLVIMLAGWLLGPRAAIAVAVLTAAACLGLLQGALLGFLPPRPPTSPALLWIVQTAVFAFSALLITYIVRSYRSRLEEVRKLGSDLAVRTAEVQAREADLNRAQAVAHVGSWVYDLAADTMRLSAETCRIFGLPEGTTGSHDTYLSRVHPEDRNDVDSAWQAALKGGEPFDSEHRITVGKTIRWVRQIAELEVGANGRPLRSVGTTQNVTERRRLEEALRAQTERLLIGQRAARMVILDWNIRNGEISWSDSPEWLRGPLPESGRYPLYVDQVHPEDRERFLALRAEGINTLQPHSHEYRIVRTDGKVLWVRSQRAVLPGADGKAARMIIALQDATERKQAEAAHAQLEGQLRESQKMEALGTLAGGVAHDFNNIVATIMGNVELARQDVGPAHAAQESLEEIRKAGRRAKDVVQQILTFGRRHALEREVIALAPVIVESARLLRATLPVGVSLSVECAPDTPEVLADATQIQQVLLNLSTNAVQATQAHNQRGTIEVRLAAHRVAAASYPGPERRSRGERITLRPGRYVCLMVRDNGSGMDDATRSRIFEPFFTTKPAGEGTGLGLSVVHGIVQAHGGSIVVQSAPSKGATFRIYLPAVDAPVAAAGERERQAESGLEVPREGGSQSLVLEGSGKHILYVDDDESIVFLMKRLLERQGYRVSGYTEARQALAAVRAEPGKFDLAVTDYNMPGMSGLEVARALREIRADLPVAVATGYVTEELRTMAPAAGVRELIYKPDSVHDLSAVVARLAQSTPG